jgi:hypothetical protein
MSGSEQSDSLYWVDETGSSPEMTSAMVAMETNATPHKFEATLGRF